MHQLSNLKGHVNKYESGRLADMLGSSCKANYKVSVKMKIPKYIVNI